MLKSDKVMNNVIGMLVGAMCATGVMVFDAPAWAALATFFNISFAFSTELNISSKIDLISKGE